MSAEPPRPPAAPIVNSYWVLGYPVIAGEYPGSPNKEDARRKLRALLRAGVTVWVDLTEENELVPYEELLRREAKQLDIAVTYLRLPIVDVAVPGPTRMAEILDTIEGAVRLNRTVYVHCWGGAGRTGTVIACYLVSHGQTAATAVRTVASLFAQMSPAKILRHPEGSPQTTEQRDFVRWWADVLPTRALTPVPAAVIEQARRPYIRGCILGGAVGDALGAPVEFLTLSAIQAQYGPQGIANLVPSYGRVGAITDDTQMTMFTAEGLLRGIARAHDRGNCYAPGIVYGAYLRWLMTQGEPGPTPPFFATSRGWLVDVHELHARRAPGNTCLAALKSGEMGSRDEPLNDSKGCGGVMRAAPVGLVDAVDHFELGCEIAALTHGHPTGYLTAGALGLLIRLIVAERMTLDAAIVRVLERLAAEPRHEETTNAIRAAVRLSAKGPGTAKRVAELGEGWIAEEALAIALYSALCAGDDFAAGVKLAVNHSGDSDSTGAIAGNLLGAMLGEQAIPEQWLATLELRAELEALANDVFTEYRADKAWLKRYPRV